LGVAAAAVGHPPPTAPIAPPTPPPTPPPRHPSPKATTPACSRERSRHARGVLDEFFYPVVVDKNRFTLPLNCPFDRAQDMYLEHERHKEQVRRTQWKSLYSDKVFRSEYYVDKHMDSRHIDKIPAGADVCLADYCEVLQCDEHQAYKHPEVRRKIGAARQARCSEEKLKGVRHFCEVLMNRCFPTGGGSHSGGGDAHGGGEDADPAAVQLHEYFVRHHCELLTCEGTQRMFHLMRGHHAEFHRGAYITMLAVLVVLLGLYYLAIYCWTKDLRRTRDLRRARKETAATRLAGWFARLSKAWPLSLVFGGGRRRKHKAY